VPITGARRLAPSGRPGLVRGMGHRWSPRRRLQRHRPPLRCRGPCGSDHQV